MLQSCLEGTPLSAERQGMMKITPHHIIECSECPGRQRCVWLSLDSMLGMRPDEGGCGEEMPIKVSCKGSR